MPYTRAIFFMFPVKKIQNIEKYTQKREKWGKFLKYIFLNFIFQKFKKRRL